MENRTTGDIGFSCGHWPPNPAKPTLILIHGAGSNHAFWNPQVEYFSEIVNVLAVDLPGHGTSPGTGRVKISEYADDVLNYIEAIQAPRPIPCGLSMGGAITQQLLISHPDRFQAGILMNTGARLRVLPSIIETIEKDYESFITMLFSFTISPKNDTEALRSEIQAGVKSRPDIAAGDFRACDGFNASDALGSIDVPVLVLAASDDKLTPVKYGEFLAKNINKGELITIQDAGHFSNLEKPAEVNRAIGDFLSRIFPDISIK